MIDELDRIWKEEAMVSWGFDSGICLERLRKTTVTSVSIAGVLDEIRNGHPRI
jgi:hypothetical protein